MTVIQPNSITGITSLSALSDTLSIHDSGGNLVRTLITGGGDVVTGVLTVSQIGNATDTLTIPGNLTVQGTRTILNTDELNINDKLVGIASTATPSSLSQDNAGLIIYGQTNVDFKYEVKKAAVGLNTALCVAGVVTAMSGLNLDATSGQGFKVGTAATVSTTGNAAFAGIVTANGGAKVGTAVSIHANGNLGITGIMTASSYVGDGSGLSGISVGIETNAQTATNAWVTLDLSKQDHKLTLAGISSIDCQGGTEGDAHTVRIINSGITTVGFSTYFLWPGGGTPVLPTTSGAIHQISFTVHHVGAAGTQLLAGASLNYS